MVDTSPTSTIVTALTVAARMHRKYTMLVTSGALRPVAATAAGTRAAIGRAVEGVEGVVGVAVIGC